MKKLYIILVCILLFNISLVIAEEEITSTDDTSILQQSGLSRIDKLKINFDDFKLRFLTLGNKIGIIKKSRIAVEAHTIALKRMKLIEDCKVENGEEKAGSCISEAVRSIQRVKEVTKTTFKDANLEVPELDKIVTQATEIRDNTKIPQVKIEVTRNKDTGDITQKKSVIMRTFKEIESERKKVITECNSGNNCILTVINSRINCSHIFLF